MDGQEGKNERNGNGTFEYDALDVGIGYRDAKITDLRADPSTAGAEVLRWVSIQSIREANTD